MTAPSRIFLVDEESEDERKLLKFASKRIHRYNPMAGYGYYEFTKPSYILPERNVIARRKVMCMDMNLTIAFDGTLYCIVLTGWSSFHWTWCSFTHWCW